MHTNYDVLGMAKLAEDILGIEKTYAVSYTHLVNMYYPDELIEEVRTRNDIVDVISDYVRLQKKGSSYFCLLYTS